MFDDLPKTREQARAIGSTRYFTGVPCKHGHVSPRYTSNCACIICSNIGATRHGKAKRMTYSVPLNSGREPAPTYVGKPCKNGHAAGIRYVRDRTCVECSKISRDIYWAKPGNREKSRIKATARRKAHPNLQMRKGRKEHRPRWCPANVFYPYARSRRHLNLHFNEGLAIDHFYPLKGTNYSGLDVPWNLQLIPEKENNRKRNKNPQRFYGENFEAVAKRVQETYEEYVRQNNAPYPSTT